VFSTQVAERVLGIRLTPNPILFHSTRPALVVYYQPIMLNELVRLMRLVVLASFATSAVVAQTATYATLHSFQGYPNDGKSPQGGVIVGSNGVLYGTTGAGGGQHVCALRPLHRRVRRGICTCAAGGSRRWLD
jgi:hypothetical protein